jgi:ABC-type Fe3+-hydroxamate transport system substrate-binding protein
MAHVTVVDDRGRKLTLPRPPERVVSLVPSDTYSIARLGGGDRLVGRTRYCVAPAPEIEAISIIGGTKDADVEAIIETHPELVVANQEENSQRDIERLEAAGVRVLVSFPRTVAAGLNHLARLAKVLGLDHGAEPARSVVAAAYHAHRAAEARAVENPVRVFLPIWMEPLMTANDLTFLSDVMRLAGGKNVFGDRDRKYPLAADLGRAAGLKPDQIEGKDTRYPRVTLDEVKERAPELILLPDEPHPFTEADAEIFRKLETPASQSNQVVFCDGKDLMWYGARSLEGIDRLRAIVDRAREAHS